MRLTVLHHEKRRGYGANQKTCYAAALKRGTEVVFMIHPDYQYDSRLIPHALGFLKTKVCDVIVGSRIRSRHEALAGRMPLYKYFSNRLLTTVENNSKEVVALLKTIDLSQSPAHVALSNM